MPDTSVVPRWLDRSAALAWRLLVVGVAGWALLTLALDLFLVVVPLFAGLVLAALLDPLAGWLRRVGANPSLAAAASLLAGVVVAGGLLALVVLRFVQQGPLFVDNLDEVRQAAMDWIRTGPLGLGPAEIQNLVDRATTQLRENTATIVSGALGGTRILLEGLSAALLSLVLAFFFVRDSAGMADWLVARLAANERRETVRAAVSDAYATLGSYVRGVVVIGFVDALGVALGLVVLDVSLVLPLSLLVFVGAFFPVVGAFVSGLAAVVVAIVTQGFVTGLLVLGILVLVQQLEGHILQPMVMGRAVPLHPAVVLVALTAGGLLAGIAGAAMAVPTAAAASAAGHRLRIGVTAGQEAHDATSTSSEQLATDTAARADVDA